MPGGFRHLHDSTSFAAWNIGTVAWSTLQACVKRAPSFAHHIARGVTSQTWIRDASLPVVAETCLHRYNLPERRNPSTRPCALSKCEIWERISFSLSATSFMGFSQCHTVHYILLGRNETSGKQGHGIWAHQIKNRQQYAGLNNDPIIQHNTK